MNTILICLAAYIIPVIIIILSHKISKEELDEHRLFLSFIPVINILVAVIELFLLLGVLIMGATFFFHNRFFMPKIGDKILNWVNKGL